MGTLPDWSGLAAILVGAGIVGGLGNALLIEGGLLVVPHMSRVADGRRAWDPGFLSNVGIGIVAGLLTLTLGVEKVTPAQQFGMALIAAVGGSGTLTNFLQKRKIRVTNRKATNATRNAREINDLNKPPGP